MIIRLKYFGMIAEALNRKEEELILEKTLPLSELVKIQSEKYPKLLKFDYRIAVNQKLEDLNFEIKTDSEVAFLPPFAGG